MKRLFTATTASIIALTASSFAVSAATEAEMNTIERYAPDANLEMLSDAQVQSVLAVINSTDSTSELYTTVPGTLDDMTEEAMVNMGTQGELSAIESYAPGVSTEMLTQDQVDASMLVINGGDSESAKRTQVRAIVLDTEVTEPAMLTEGQKADIEFYLPEMDVAMLPQDTARAILNIIASADSQSETRQAVRALVY